MKTVAIAMAAVAVLTTPLLAHDFWLMPTPGHAAPGGTITVTINVGEQYPAPDAFVEPDRVQLVQLVGPGGHVTALAPRFTRQGEGLATPVTLPATPGTYIVETRLKTRFIELQPKEFTAYLEDEGLGRVVAERQRLRETEKPGRERYSRWPKALIRTGDGDATHVTTPLGVISELVPDVDPTRAKPGEVVAFQLRFEGKPVPGARLSRIVTGTAPFAQRLSHATTDAAGWARFTVAEGPQFIGTVHMVRRGGETGPEAADWESYWTSLTFESSH